MRFLPSLNDMFDDFFDDSIDARDDAMLCDITEHDHDYEMNMSMPGFNKDDIHIDLTNGYLNISAETNTNNDEKDDNGQIIRVERYHGKMARSFYVGDNVDRNDIKASYDNGELHITLPKNNQALENNSYIEIE